MSPDQSVLESPDLAGICFPFSKIPQYSNVLSVDYHIVVPIFNEGDGLEGILEKIKSLGYLHKITFVNDASTDNSRNVLQRWEGREGIEVLHLIENRKKEGAIREVLEILNRQGRLADKIILLDADSFLVPKEKGVKLEDIIAKASRYMDQENVAGMAFRMDPLLPEKPNFLQKAQYAEYSAVRFWNRITSKQEQLWVINGPGGIFRGDLLLFTLRDMVPDFETGDLLITVKMMKHGHRVGYYTGIKVQTTVPKTVAGLFKQRRRWERGTTKVLFNEKSFYLKQFMGLRILALQTIINFLIPLGILVQIVRVPFFNLKQFMIGVVINYMFWMFFNTVVVLSDSDAKKEKDRLRILKWFFLQGFAYTAIAVPARVAGFYDAVKWLCVHDY